MNELIIQNSQVVSCAASEEINEVFDCQATSLQLTEREQKAVVVNFESGLYDIAAEVIWRRTISILRDRLAIFGDEFVGDMLGYDKPISADNISEQDVIELNSDVGFLRADAKMELLHHSEQIKNYTSREYQMVEKISINKNHAKTLIADCITFVLSDMTECSMLKFNDIRKLLSTELLNSSSEFVINLSRAEYFEKRTILRSLMNMAKIEKEEEKQTVFHNMRIIVPAIWDGLAEKDKYSFGTTYAEISNTDRKDYINAVKTILITVHGFDYVPENLKSNSFIAAAKNLTYVHNAINNFYNEPLAAKTLAYMGTMIPDPAVFDCINATIICATGNGYGVSNEAQQYLQKILNTMTLQKWELYLKDLSKNVELLYQLGYVSNTAERWANIINERNLSQMKFSSQWTNDFLQQTLAVNTSAIKSMAKNRYIKITE